MLLLLLACAQTPCERFVEARAACYAEAGVEDGQKADGFCDDAADDAATFDALYACYAEAYEAGPCATEDEVATVNADASTCQDAG